MSILVHIHRPSGYYVGQIRKRGYKRWETIGGHTQNKTLAITRAIKAMTSEHKRARVLWCADWYEPNIVSEFEIK